MRTLVLILATWLLALPVGAQDWRDPDLGNSLREGLATREHIWLLGASGKVARFDRRTGEREIVAEKVRDLLPAGGKLWALIGADDGATWLLRDLRNPGPPSGEEAERSRLYLHPSETSGGEAIGLVDWPGQNRPTVLAQRMFLAPTAGGWDRRSLAATLGTGGRIAVTGDGLLYVGYNLGEWGGGLRRIDTREGSVAFARETSADLCGGAINPACTPVIGLFRDPDQPGCVVVGTGIAHLSTSQGEVFRVCGDAITSVFKTPTPTVKDRWMMSPQPWPLHGFVETPDGWVGASRDRYFRSRGGHVEERPMPAFTDWSGLRISEEQDGVLFLISSCCWGSTDSPTLYGALALPVVP
ncbi:hypothetical protein ACIQC9_01680 [Brevundimonas sp. NPDC092305]|uniref:hypothetical protein n=1 Tax=Brevundimonas sp. NPDC092305 TaxID=3363957 RepID=UPI00382B8A6C